MPASASHKGIISTSLVRIGEAIRKRRDAELREEQALRLIFEPGLSTAEAVTEVSGRGAGIEALSGRLVP
jgi:hypothetical protein